MDRIPVQVEQVEKEYSNGEKYKGGYKDGKKHG